MKPLETHELSRGKREREEGAVEVWTKGGLTEQSTLEGYNWGQGNSYSTIVIKRRGGVSSTITSRGKKGQVGREEWKPLRIQGTGKRKEKI